VVEQVRPSNVCGYLPEREFTCRCGTGSFITELRIWKLHCAMSVQDPFNIVLPSMRSLFKWFTLLEVSEQICVLTYDFSDVRRVSTSCHGIRKFSGSNLGPPHLQGCEDFSWFSYEPLRRMAGK
jgi:hypothetical protein